MIYRVLTTTPHAKSTSAAFSSDIITIALLPTEGFPPPPVQNSIVILSSWRRRRRIRVEIRAGMAASLSNHWLVCYRSQYSTRLCGQVQVLSCKISEWLLLCSPAMIVYLLRRCIHKNDLDVPCIKSSPLRGHIFQSNTIVRTTTRRYSLLDQGRNL
jgi:hypothetical protein